jgi:hypothetical protein
MALPAPAGRIRRATAGAIRSPCLAPKPRWVKYQKGPVPSRASETSDGGIGVGLLVRNLVVPAGTRQIRRRDCRRPAKPSTGRQGVSAVRGVQLTTHLEKRRANRAKLITLRSPALSRPPTAGAAAPPASPRGTCSSGSGHAAASADAVPQTRAPARHGPSRSPSVAYIKGRNRSSDEGDPQPDRSARHTGTPAGPTARCGTEGHRTPFSVLIRLSLIPFRYGMQSDASSASDETRNSLSKIYIIHG